MNSNCKTKSRSFTTPLGGTENAIALILALLLLVLVFTTQQRMAVNSGQGWDGLQYVSMVDPTARVPAPYNLRIGYPFLVRHIAPFANRVDNFALFSIAFGTIFAWLSYRALYRWFPTAPRGARLLAWSVLNLSELSPLRMAQWYPANTDLPFNLIFLVLLVVLLENWAVVYTSLALTAIFFTGTLIRENFIISLALVALVKLVTFEGRRTWIHLSPSRVVPFVAALVGTCLAAVVIKFTTGDWLSSGKTDTMLGWLRTMRFAPFTQAFIAVHGFVILLFVASLGWSPLWRRQSGAFIVFLLLTIPIAITGGENYERFFFWYIVPVVYLALPMIQVLWQGRRWFELCVAFTHVLVIHRYYAPIDPLTEYSLDAGCTLTNYLHGYSPSLMHYALVCRTDNCVPFFAFFGVCLLLVLAARIGFSRQTTPDPTSSY